MPAAGYQSQLPVLQPGTSLEISNGAPGLSSSSDIDQMVPVLVDASHLLPGGDRKSLPLSCQVRCAGRTVPCGLLAYWALPLLGPKGCSLIG